MSHRSAPPGSSSGPGPGCSSAPAGRPPAAGRRRPGPPGAAGSPSTSAAPTSRSPRRGTRRRRPSRCCTASSPATVLGRITAPTLLVQGEADSLFPLSEGDANARGIASQGTPVKVVWYGGGHDGGLDETDRLRALGARLVRPLPEAGRHTGGHPVRGDRARGDDLERGQQPRAADPGRARRTRGHRGGAVRTRPVPLSGPAQPVVAPAGRRTRGVTSLPGLGSALVRSPAPGSAAAPPPRRPRRRPRRLGGVGDRRRARALRAGRSGRRLRVRAAGADAARSSGAPGSACTCCRDRLGTATLFAQLYDVAPGGSATLPQQLVSPVRLTGLTAAGTDVDGQPAGRRP